MSTDPKSATSGSTITEPEPLLPDLRSGHELLRVQPLVASAVAEFPAPEQFFPRVLGAIADTLGFGFGAVWRPDVRTGILEPSAVWTHPSLAGEELRSATAASRLAPGEDVPGRVLSEDGPVWIRDVREASGTPRAAACEAAGLRTHVAFPLALGSQLEGVMEFMCQTLREPDPALLSWFATSGTQIAQYLDRWRAHEDLLKRDRALEAAVNGVVIADATLPGFPIIYANPGFERLTGYAEHEVLGRPCSFVQGEDTDPSAIGEFRSALAEERECRTTILNYRKDGTTFWNEVFLSPVHDGDGRLIQYVGVQNDVSDRRRAEEQVAYLAYHDSLTGLANRALLGKVVDRAIERGHKHGLEVALLYLDLDNFKIVNDSLGHAAGDRLLCTVAERLRHATRASDVLARQGGDEFLVVLADIEGDAEALAARKAEEIRQSLREPVELEGSSVQVTASIGISLFPRDAEDAGALLGHADAAMYRAKRAGGGGYRVFSTWSRQVRNRGPVHALKTVDEAPVDRAELESILAESSVRSVYQPMVELDTGRPVAYEALARGPADSSLERPDRLFAAAAAVGRLADLDWTCRAAALEGAMDAGMRSPLAVFVNMEPEVLGTKCPPHLVDVWDRSAAETLKVVVEITERALTTRPAELLHALRGIRERGWGVALDDVGADTRSLALMPLLRPDVIKLDLRLVHEQPTTEIAEIVNAVNAQRERTGAVILAEGIETEQHVQTARAMGATLGQGWYFDRPGALPTPLPVPPREVSVADRSSYVPGSTPYEVVKAVREVRRGDKRLLLAISHLLENQAAGLGAEAVIVSAFQDAERFTKATQRRYSNLAGDAAFVGALGVGMDPEPTSGVRGAALELDDPLLGEWSVAVIGSHFAAALVAVDLGHDGPDYERLFNFALTYDRELVIEAANSLMQRVVPLGEPAALEPA